MKKSAVLLIGCVALMTSAALATAHTGEQPAETNLIAGKDTVVGTVKVWNGDETLHVLYETTGEWYLTETRFHVATSLDGIPHTRKGNPILGKFDHRGPCDPPAQEAEYQIDLDGWTEETQLYIAARAVVVNRASTEISVELYDWGRSAESAAGIADSGILGGAVEAGFALEVDPDQTVWNMDEYYQGAGEISEEVEQYATWPQYGACRDKYEVRRFRAFFDLLSNVELGDVVDVVLYSPFYDGDIIPINDNMYVRLNGEDIGSRGTSYDALRMPDSMYETDRWYDTGSFGAEAAVHLQTGVNTLDIAIEEFCGGGGMNRLDLKLTVLAPGDDGEAESAWGEGARFVTKGNWAMYFTYVVQ